MDLQLSYLYPWIAALLAALGLLVTHILLVRRRQQMLSMRNEALWASVLEHDINAVLILDASGRIVRASKMFYRQIGRTQQQAVGVPLEEIIHPEEGPSQCELCQARKKGGEISITLDVDDPHNLTGQISQIEQRVVRNHIGKPIAFVLCEQVLNAPRAHGSLLTESQTFFPSLLESMPSATVVVDEAGQILIANTLTAKLFGYRYEELIGANVEILIPPESRAQHSVLREEYNWSPQKRVMGAGRELSGATKTGDVVPVEIALSPFELDGHRLTTVVMRDIAEQLANDRERERMASFPELSPIPVIEVDLKGVPTYMNPVSVELFEDLQEHRTLHPMINGIEEIIEHMKTTGRSYVRTVELDGKHYEQKLTYLPSSKLVRIYAWDITDLQEMTQRMAYQASHDALTGLYNRAEFEKKLEQEIQISAYENKEHVLCYMDLDQFKIVNDTCGHAAGDELLKQLTSLLRSRLRNSDMLARLGGDEFGLLLVGCPLNRAIKIAEQVRSAVSDFRFNWDKKIFSVGLSIGVVLINEHSGSLADILSAADAACYVAKEQGRNRIHIYRPNDAMLTRHAVEMGWTHRIQEALDEGRFCLYRQEVRSLSKDVPSFYEVLVRMVGAKGKLISPAAFISAAERYHQMSKVDAWVIRNTFSLMSDAHPDIICSVNLSGQSLSNNEIMRLIIEQLDSYDVDPERIIFEITETAAISNISYARRFISTLKGMGCRFALDDFGSGLSSFSYLRALPVDFLKIDGAIVRSMQADKVGVAMVEAINRIGQTMEIKTVAEFIENPELLGEVQAIGIDYVQGHAISMPEPFVGDMGSVLSQQSSMQK